MVVQICLYRVLRNLSYTLFNVHVKIWERMEVLNLEWQFCHIWLLHASAAPQVFCLEERWLWTRSWVSLAGLWNSSKAARTFLSFLAEQRALSTWWFYRTSVVLYMCMRQCLGWSFIKGLAVCLFLWTSWLCLLSLLSHICYPDGAVYVLSKLSDNTGRQLISRLF